MANLDKYYVQNEIALFPLTLDEMVPASHRARVVNAVIDGLDISAIEDMYKDSSTSIYHSRMLLKVKCSIFSDNPVSPGRVICPQLCFMSASAQDNKPTKKPAEIQQAL